MNAPAKVEQPEAMLPADPMVSMIERVAMDPSVPIERLERMMDLKDRHDANQREMQEREAERAYNCAMAKAQSAMPTVAKSKRNDHTRSTYADLSDIEEQAMPIAYRHGFSVSFNPGGKDEQNNLLVNWTVMHEDGHTKTGQAGFPLDAAGAQGKTNKTGIQAMGSTMTYARRYLICNLFNIATDDDNDGNGKPAETIGEDQLQQIESAIAKIGLDQSVVLRAERINVLHELPAAKFKTVMDNLRVNATRRGVKL